MSRALRWSVSFSSLLGALFLTGCFSVIDLTGRRCPCDEGWSCVEGRCVEEGTDAGRPDVPGDVAADVPRPTEDVPEDAGISACPEGAFCEDFESSNPAANGWTVFPDRSRVNFVFTTPDPDVTPHGGMGMVRITTVTPGGASDITICPFDGFTCPTVLPDAGVTPDGGVSGLPGITSGDIYMRAYIWAPSTLPSGMPFVQGHASVLYVGSHRGPWAAGETITGFNLDVERTSMYIGTIGQRVEPRPMMGDPDTRPMFPLDEWVCVRVHVRVDPTDGAAETFIGSDPTPDVRRTGIDTLPNFPYMRFGVGLGYTDEMPNGAAIYADDVAFGRMPIPCID